VFLVNSRHPLFALPGSRPAPLIPRIRGQFAEFLWWYSLDALVFSTSPLVSVWVQCCQPRYFLGSASAPRTGAAPRLTSRHAVVFPVEHAAIAVLVGTVSYGDQIGHAATLGLSAGGRLTRLKLLMPALLPPMPPPHFRAVFIGVRGIPLPPRIARPAPSAPWLSANKLLGCAGGCGVTYAALRPGELLRFL